MSTSAPRLLLLLSATPTDREPVRQALLPGCPEFAVRFIADEAELAAALAAGPFDAALVAPELAWVDSLQAARRLRAACPDSALLLIVDGAAEPTGPVSDVWDGWAIRVADRWPALPLALRLARTRRAVEARYRDLFDNVPVGLYQSLPDGRILDANRALLQMLGYPDRESLLSVNAVDLYVDPLERTRWQALMQRGAALHAFETRFRRRDGAVIWVSDSTHVVREAGGRGLYYEGILEDITDRKQAELALSESEERFRTIVSQAPISIQVLTPDGWTVQVNPAWEKLWGVTAADVQHYNMLEDEQARSLGMMPYVERGFAGETVLMPPVAYHTPESLKAGRKRWFQARLYPVKSPRGEIRNLIMMYEDITDRQWATEDLQRLSAELMQAQEAERKRISEELHDELGQALTAIRINLAALEKELGPGLAPQPRARLAEAGELVDAVLEQVRELSHALRPAMLDELGLLPTLRWSVSRFGERLGLEARFEAADLDERPAAECETVLYRVVQEALANIARHARARHVRVRLARQGERITAWVEDDGVGFDPQRPAAGDAPALGLVGMRERVTRLGGTLTLNSAPGRGTRLTVELPWTPRPAGDET